MCNLAQRLNLTGEKADVKFMTMQDVEDPQNRLGAGVDLEEVEGTANNVFKTFAGESESKLFGGGEERLQDWRVEGEEGEF